MEEPDGSIHHSDSESELRADLSLKSLKGMREGAGSIARGRSPPRERRPVKEDPLTFVGNQARPINGGSSEASMKSVVSVNVKQDDVKPQKLLDKEFPFKALLKGTL